MLSIGTFEPDKLDLDGSTSRLIRNVLPKGNSYGPMAGPSIFGTSTLPAQCVGLAFARTNSGGWLVFAGTKTKLYKLISDAWVDYSRTVGGNYNVPDGEFWSFAQFGAQLIACNYNDDPQVIDVDSAATSFTALAGSPPKARIVKATQGFVRLAGMATDPYGDRWSDLEDATTWTFGSGATGLSDRQYFPTGGRVMNVTGGYTGFVLQEQAIKSFQFLPGSQYVWQYTEVEGARGCVAPYSVAAVGSTTFYLAEDGFYSIDVQAGLKPIGATRVNNWWRDNTDASRRSSIMAVADPVAPRIYWVGYSTAGVTSFDIGLVYDWQLDQWAEFRTSAQVFAAIATPGKSLEDLNAYGSLENVPASLDSAIWEGDKPTFGGISSASKLIFMSGPSLEAKMVLPRVQANPGGRAFVNEVRPVIDTSSASLRIGTGERMQDPVAYGSAASLDPTGKFNVRSSGRIHEIELTIPAGTAWTHCQGVDISAVPDGKR
jgi:hypothetical protein